MSPFRFAKDIEAKVAAGELRLIQTDWSCDLDPQAVICSHGAPYCGPTYFAVPEAAIGARPEEACTDDPCEHGWSPRG